MDENTQATENVEVAEDQATETKPETDWKAEARKWEKRAKENSKAADELAQLKESQMTELEKAQAAAEKAQAEADALKAEKAKTDAVIKTSAETGIPAELLAFCSDAETVKAFAEALKSYAEKASPIHVGTLTKASRIVKPDQGAARTNAAGAIADFISNQH